MDETTQPKLPKLIVQSFDRHEKGHMEAFQQYRERCQKFFAEYLTTVKWTGVQQPGEAAKVLKEKLFIAEDLFVREMWSNVALYSQRTRHVAFEVLCGVLTL